MPALPTPHSAMPVIAYAPPTLDPLRRIVKAYDKAIRACEAFDHHAARQSIGLLRSALELDGPAARSFDALYAWCEEAVDGHDFVGPARTLRTLRDAWCQAAEPAPITVNSGLPIS